MQIDQYSERGSFRFGILRLLHWLDLAHQNPVYSTVDEAHRAWASKWRRHHFVHSVRTFQEAFWKLDRSAAHIGRCIERIEQHRNSHDMSEFALFTDALRDIPLYLDLILMYIRIQADTFVHMVPYFYNRPPQVPVKSFRTHMKWFTDTRSSFDPEYSLILREHTDWFNILSGKETSGSNKGIRDIFVHHQGLYQLQWNEPSATGKFELEALLVSQGFGVHENLISTLRFIIASYFTYLDRTFVHYADNLRDHFGTDFIPVGVDAAQYYEFTGAAPASAWIYPALDVSAKVE